MAVGQHEEVLVLDYGSQYTQLIARRVRELGIFSEILPSDVEQSRVEQRNIKAIVLSGGPSSVYDDGAPALSPYLLKVLRDGQIPVLGICYGMQLLVQHFKGKIDRADSREYGRMAVVPESNSRLLSHTKKNFNAWMSHGDETSELPAGFQLSAKSASGAVAGMEDSERGIYGLQFHPEVIHTEKGEELLKHFLIELCGIHPDWKMGDLVEEQIAAIRETVGEDETVICGLSGGVDSTVAAVLVHQAIGDRLHCVFVDHGLLRFKERERVMKVFEDHLHLKVHAVDASDRFLGALSGVEDPEKKRKIIGREFIAVFEEEAKRIAKEMGSEPKYLVQGTLYPDVIESSPPPQAGGKKFSTTIKSHHNVGGLPEKMNLKLIEPLRELFKDEVREMGKKLNIPEPFLKRHPFPGPGLAVRILGEITRERIDVLQRVDEIYISEIRDTGLYDEIWQAFAVFLPIRSVGVQGDGRSHSHVVGLRAVTSKDGMTADWYPFEASFLSRVSTRICNEVHEVNRVVLDVTSKPPATIEWE